MPTWISVSVTPVVSPTRAGNVGPLLVPPATGVHGPLPVPPTATVVGVWTGAAVGTGPAVTASPVAARAAGPVASVVVLPATVAGRLAVATSWLAPPERPIAPTM